MNYAESALTHYEYHEPEHFKAAKGYEYHAQMADAVKAAGGFTQMFADTQVIETPDRCIHVLRKDPEPDERVGVRRRLQIRRNAV